jgi:hypothetical protein
MLRRALLLAVALTGCAAAPIPPAATPCPTCPPAAKAPAACPGAIEVPAGLKPARDSALYKQAVDEPGAGGLCTAQVFEVTQPVAVYRVWNKAKDYTLLGRWWSFAKPVGPVEAYRKDNAICPEWSQLDVVSTCTLKVGAKIVVGPGQSAGCKDGTYPASATNQVFVPNETKDPAKQVVWVEGCSAGVAWP